MLWKTSTGTFAHRRCKTSSKVNTKSVIMKRDNKRQLFCYSSAKACGPIKRLTTIQRQLRGVQDSWFTLLRDWLSWQHAKLKTRRSWVRFSISTDFWARFPLSTTFFQRKAWQGNALARGSCSILSMHAISGTCVIFRPRGGGPAFFNRVNSL